jgi:hypothetical protein
MNYDLLVGAASFQLQDAHGDELTNEELVEFEAAKVR